MRLTNKDYKDRVGKAFDELVFLANINPNDVCKFPVINLREQELKLGQIEDIEEELGIDLITLFKALKNGIYVKDKYNAFEDNGDKWFIVEIENEIGFYHKQLKVSQFTKRKQNGLFGDDEYCPPTEKEKANGTWRSTVVYFKDYGKTWALTKEELL